MGDERRDREKDAGKENPQDEREGGYGSPEERKEEMERAGSDRERGDRSEDR